MSSTLQSLPCAFWGELAPCDHLLQVYDDETHFMETLERFIGDGLASGDGAIVIATASHLTWLEARLRALGHDVESAREGGRYVALDAAATLATFMVEGWPDERRFIEAILPVVQIVGSHGRAVRAFGEMVALLWAQGHTEATLQLERLWNRFCSRQALALFCAYPRIGATRDFTEGLDAVCALHSKVDIAEPAAGCGEHRAAATHDASILQ